MVFLLLRALDVAAAALFRRRRRRRRRLRRRHLSLPISSGISSLKSMWKRERARNKRSCTRVVVFCVAKTRRRYTMRYYGGQQSRRCFLVVVVVVCNEGDHPHAHLTRLLSRLIGAVSFDDTNTPRDEKGRRRRRRKKRREESTLSLWSVFSHYTPRERREDFLPLK